MNENINISEEQDKRMYGSVIEEFLSKVLDVVEETWERESKKIVMERVLDTIAERLLHDIRDNDAYRQHMIQGLGNRTRILTNGSLKQNMRDTFQPIPRETHGVQLGKGSSVNPLFTKSTLFETYAISSHHKTPCSPTVVHVTQVTDSHVLEDIKSSRDALKVTENTTDLNNNGNTLKNKGFGQRLRKFATTVFSCFLPKSAD